MLAAEIKETFSSFGCPNYSSDVIWEEENVNPWRIFSNGKKKFKAHWAHQKFFLEIYGALRWSITFFCNWFISRKFFDECSDDNKIGELLSVAHCKVNSLFVLIRFEEKFRFD